MQKTNGFACSMIRRCGQDDGSVDKQGVADGDELRHVLTWNDSQPPVKFLTSGSECQWALDLQIEAEKVLPTGWASVRPKSPICMEEMETRTRWPRWHKVTDLIKHSILGRGA